MDDAPLYAAFLDLQDRPVLVVGGGSVAARKARVLADAGARLTVVSPETCPDVDALESEGRASVERRPYRTDDVQGAWLIVAATGDRAVNRQVYKDAEEQGTFCNVVDCPELCSFQVPATVQRGQLQVAISTHGACPLLSRRLRQGLEKQFGPEYGPLLDGLRELREYLKRTCDDEAERRRRLKEFMDSGAPELLLEDGDEAGFRRRLRDWMEE